MSQKLCPHCNITKGISNFYKKKDKKDGLSAVCKCCYKESNNKYRNSDKWKTKKENRQVNVERKVCSKCQNSLSSDLFHFSGESKDGLKSYCKECTSTESAQYYIVKVDHFKKKRENRKEYQRKYREENKDTIHEHKKEWSKRPEVIKRRSEVQKLRKDLDPIFKLKSNLRSRLNAAIRKNVKTGSAIKDLGCSMEEFKLHLESKFPEGMCWENYGKGINKWSIDHIMPLDAFDLTKRDELTRACHYTNLQPLWNIDNSRKSNKIMEETTDAKR